MSDEHEDRRGDHRPSNEGSIPDRRANRRAVLATIGAGAIGALAGCGVLTSDGEPTKGSPTQTATPTATARAGETATVAETENERFHIFGCSWAPDHVVWYVDGSERYRVDGWAERLSAEPMFPNLSTYVVDVDDYSESDTAITGDHADADYPYTHEVEWIRVWQHQDWE